MSTVGDDFASFRKTPAWLLVFFNNLFCGCAGFSIVLPTVWPYLREFGSTPRFFALVVAAYSIGEGLGGLACGRLYDVFPGGPKALLLTTMTLGFGAALAYTTAALCGETAAPFVILASRFVSGVDNGARQTVEQTVIGSVVPAEWQTTVSSRLSSFAITGMMLGPAFGAPLQALDLEVPLCGLRINGNNGPGLVLCVVCLVNILATTRHFDAHSVLGAGHRSIATAGKTVSEVARLSNAPRPSKIGVATCFIAFALVNLSMASLETITPLVAQRLYGWGPCLHPSSCHLEAARTYVNLLLSMGGIVSLINSMINACCLGRFIYGKEVYAILLALMAYVVTNTMNIDFGGSLPAWRFVLGYLVGAFFGGFLRGPSVSLLSQVIGSHGNKAPYIGTLFAIGAVPRIVGPFLFVELLTAPPPLHDMDFPDVYDGPVPRTWLLYGSQAALNAAAVLVVALARGPIRRHLEVVRSFEKLSEPLLPSP